VGGGIVVNHEAGRSAQNDGSRTATLAISDDELLVFSIMSGSPISRTALSYSLNTMKPPLSSVNDSGHDEVSQDRLCLSNL
jgi:hypothetical protein